MSIHRVKIGKVRPKRFEHVPMVSDHAVVRFIERGFGLQAEVSDLRQRLARYAQAAVIEGRSHATVEAFHADGNPCVLVINGQHITTVLDASKPRDQTFSDEGISA